MSCQILVWTAKKALTIIIVAAKMMITIQVALETLEGHQRAIMGSMTVEVDFHFGKLFKKYSDDKYKQYLIGNLA